MIRQALEYLNTLCNAAQEIQVRTFPSERIVMVAHNGVLKEYPIPHPRDHVVYDLDGFCLAVNTWGDNATVWHSEGRIVGVLDDNERRDKVELVFGRSAELLALMNLGTKKKPKEVVRYLKHHLGSVFSADLIARLESIRWQKSSDEEQDLSAGQDSMGRKVVKIATSGGEPIPDQETVQVPFYDRLQSVLVTLTVSIVQDHEHNELILSVQPVSKAAAYQKVQEYIHSQLVKLLDQGQAIVFNGEFAGEE